MMGKQGADEDRGEIVEKVIAAGEKKRTGGPGTSQRGTTKGARTELVRIGPETPGYKLLLIFQTAAEHSMTLNEVAEATGVAPSTLSHLRTGRRLATHLDREIMVRIAEWLEVPVLSALILAEQVTLKDFYVGQSRVDRDIRRALRYIRDDPKWCGLMPRELEHASDDMKLWTIWCYEHATGARLLNGGVNYQALLDEMEQYREECPAQSEQDR